MLTTMNITTSRYDLERFANAAELVNFYTQNGLDGLEVMPYADDGLGIIPADSVLGLHLTCYPSWMDFYQNNEAGILREFGTRECAQEYYHCAYGRDMIAQLRAQLELAQRLKVRYVVFHVSDISPLETVTSARFHTNAGIIEASAELINAALADGRFEFELLLENMWGPGFTFTEPELTRRLLASVNYPRTGIMLDTGHLMHSNRALRTQRAAVDYILAMLDAHARILPDISARIRGIHLQQNLAGEYIENMLAARVALHGSYMERLGQAYAHVLRIDAHQPFTDPAVRRLIPAIAPQYLTYEFITESNAQYAEFIQAQHTALGRMPRNNRQTYAGTQSMSKSK